MGIVKFPDRLMYLDSRTQVDAIAEIIIRNKIWKKSSINFTSMTTHTKRVGEEDYNRLFKLSPAIWFSQSYLMIMSFQKHHKLLTKWWYLLKWSIDWKCTCLKSPSNGAICFCVVLTLVVMFKILRFWWWNKRRRRWYWSSKFWWKWAGCFALPWSITA